MPNTKRRSRNIARKPKSRPSGFVPQNKVAPSGEQRSDLAANTTPEPGSRQAGFVPQNPTVAEQFNQTSRTN